jgi:hypothetical protein
MPGRHDHAHRAGAEHALNAVFAREHFPDGHWRSVHAASVLHGGLKRPRERRGAPGGSGGTCPCACGARERLRELIPRKARPVKRARAVFIVSMCRATKQLSRRSKVDGCYPQIPVVVLQVSPLGQSPVFWQDAHLKLSQNFVVQ